LEILKIFGQNIKLKDIEFEEIAKKTEHFSSADVVALLKEARITIANKFYQANL